MSEISADEFKNLKNSVDKIVVDLNEIREFLTWSKTTIKFLIVVGKIIKWVAGIATAILAIFATYKAFTTGINFSSHKTP